MGDTPGALELFWKQKGQKPDLLHTMTAVPNIWGRGLTAMTTDSVAIASWRGKQEQQFESLLWRLTDRLICTVNALKKFVAQEHGVDPRRVADESNGADINFFTLDFSCQDRFPTVVFVGRLVKEKEPLTLIEAFNHLRSLVDNVHLLMIGQGNLNSEVQKK